MENPIEFVGAAAEDAAALAEEVRRLLSTREISLSYGSDFMGRPGTLVHSCERYVVKLRAELRFKPAVARRWCHHAQERELRFGVHHPGKAWFLAAADNPEDDAVSVGNLCPRLNPLHILLQAPPASAEERGRRLRWLEAVLAMDARLNSEFGMRVDLGLSNFGVDGDGGLFYLDDDFYAADGWVAMAHMLGVYLRQHLWIDEAFAAGLGGGLRSVLLRYFADPHHITVLAGQLGGLFMPNEGRRAVLRALIQALVSRSQAVNPPAPAHAKKLFRQRYFALLADVHANLPALDAALDFLQREGIREGLVLGDVVGYGPHPVECIERLQGQAGLALLRGNHDHAAATGICGQGFSNTARWCIEWTAPRLSEAHKAWLLALPVTLEEDGWLAVHGAPVDPTFFNAYVYHMSYAQNLDALEQRGIALCFHGHSHMAGVYYRNRAGVDGLAEDKQVSLEGFRHCLVCPGAVGQPRNRDSGAQLAVLDREGQRLTFVTLPYAVEKTARDMEQAGFPVGLSNRLFSGW